MIGAFSPSAEAGCEAVQPVSQRAYLPAPPQTGGVKLVITAAFYDPPGLLLHLCRLGVANRTNRDDNKQLSVCVLTRRDLLEWMFFVRKHHGS